MSSIAKIAATAITKRIKSLAEKDLARLAPEAIAAKEYGRAPLMVPGPTGVSAYGQKTPPGVFLQPTLDQHLLTLVRSALKRQPPDRLAAKEPGRIAELANRSDYW